MSSLYPVSPWVLPLKQSTSSDLSRELNLSISLHTGCPHSQRQVVDEQIDDMLQQGVIQPSKSPWNSPLFLVPKKYGQFRPVIDFRKVNEVTEDDRFPLPVLSDLLMSLEHGNKFFSSLDLLSGYWQVPLAPESREITAFSTPHGHFEWLRMPFWS